ncbi:MAG: EF2563 family selenium-dependent molybdenum hydroxylase system protein [Candidatus Marinimicrobia bacterium]|nr:EF2563 family selenium-dependent molybdenum hydroxylase system protein [Candidatus Neomarinimicrobiota bacterium]
MFDNINIVIRGAGELASATALILHKIGFKVILTELQSPLAIRRTVTFSDAIITNEATVEGITARFYKLAEIEAGLPHNILPIVYDNMKVIKTLKPQIIVDARMLKREPPETKYGSAFVVGLGPGFTVGKNCRVIIETKRGHELGRLIWQGSAIPNTGIPGVLGGESYQRIITAPAEGRIHWRVDFGNLVKKSEILGTVDQFHQIIAPIAGIIRGLISPKIVVSPRMKIGDVDPRGKEINVNLISDKARSIGRGVLEAILQFLQQAD